MIRFREPRNLFELLLLFGFLFLPMLLFFGITVLAAGWGQWLKIGYVTIGRVPTSGLWTASMVLGVILSVHSMIFLLVGLNKYISIRSLIGIIAPYCLLGSSLSFFGGYTANYVEADILSRAYSVCRYGTIPEAKPYQGAGPHRLVILEWKQKDPIQAVVFTPVEWQPISITDLELVVCIDDEQEILIETCRYVGGTSMNRYQYQRHFRVIEAKTGNVILEDTLKGSFPEECPSVTARSDAVRRGSHAEIDTIIKRLTNLVVANR